MKLTTVSGNSNGHFNIGSWAKKRRIDSQPNNVQLVNEKVLKKGVGMLAAGGQGDAAGAFQGSRSKFSRPLGSFSSRIEKGSRSDIENCDHLQLAHQTKRLHQTFEAIKLVNACIDDSKCEQEQSVKDAIWAALVHFCSSEEIISYIGRSKTFQKKVLPHLPSNSSHTPIIQSPLERSARVLYDGGLISKVKYSKLRAADVDTMKSMSVNSLQAVLPYKCMVKQLQTIHVSQLEATPMTSIAGCQRSLETLLLRLADMYLHMDKHHQFLDWFGGREGHFRIAIGADGAPFGKNETATSFVISVLNTVSRVASARHNFLLVGGNIDESATPFIEVVRNATSEMKVIQQKSYMVAGMEVTFTVDLVPSDQKWLATASGELSNAATYPSSFGNVTNANINQPTGTFGEGPEHSWRPWSYDKQLSDAAAVAKFKTDKTPRAKVTKFIADLKSRQETLPPLSDFIKKAKVEPLHIMNLAWQRWNHEVLLVVLDTTDAATLRKAKTVFQLPDEAPFAQYLRILRKEIRAGKLFNKIARWFMEDASVSKPPTIRFTGEESRKFCQNYYAFFNESVFPELPFKMYVLAYAGQMLRDSAAIFTRVHISEQDLCRLDHACKMYYRVHALFLRMNLTVWTLGQVVPVHTRDMYNAFGYGLGLNTMQGREAKHQQLLRYMQHTPGLKPENRWEIVFRHEFADLIWLPKSVPSCDTYRRKSGFIHSENDLLVPSFCSLPGNCSCGRMKQDGVCCVCDAQQMLDIKDACKEGYIAFDVRKWCPT